MREEGLGFGFYHPTTADRFLPELRRRVKRSKQQTHEESVPGPGGVKVTPLVAVATGLNSTMQIMSPPKLRLLGPSRPRSQQPLFDISRAVINRPASAGCVDSMLERQDYDATSGTAKLFLPLIAPGGRGPRDGIKSVH